jgi:hypothetical protein
MSANDLDDAGQLEGDRKTVAALVAAGDPLTKPRQVDHWIYFPTSTGRDAFTSEATELGFTVTNTHDEAEPPNHHCVCVSRVDRVDLQSIHRVVMTLFAAAKRNSGDYDGWECPVETDE